MDSDDTVPDRGRVRFTERALHGLEGEHEDCAFCLGRHAGHRGLGVDVNPFDDVPDETTKWYDTDYGLWLFGHDLGSTEPGGLLWFEQPNRGPASDS